MSKRPIDPDEIYEIHKMLSCEDGHFWGPGYTHWEQGECCPLLDHDGDPHLYFRNIMVPVEASDGGSLWEKLNKPEHQGKLGWLPVAP